MIDRVAEMATGHVWREATRMNIYEFLSIYSYCIAKQRQEQNELKRQYESMKTRVRH